MMVLSEVPVPGKAVLGQMMVLRELPVPGRAVLERLSTLRERGKAGILQKTADY